MSVTFRGGIHPPQNKVFTKDKPIIPLHASGEVIIPLSQHTGAPAKPIVEKGEEVLMGKKVAESVGFISLPVHSSVSG